MFILPTLVKEGHQSGRNLVDFYLFYSFYICPCLFSLLFPYSILMYVLSNCNAKKDFYLARVSSCEVSGAVITIDLTPMLLVGHLSVTVYLHRGLHVVP